MDAQKVEDVRRDEQRIYLFLRPRPVESVVKRLHVFGRSVWRHGFEPDHLPAAGVLFDDVVAGRLPVPTASAGVFEQVSVKLSNHTSRKLDVFVTSVNGVQDIAVARNGLLRARFRSRAFVHQFLDALWGCPPFNSI
nr:hypothetical protein [Salinibacter sp.]